MRFEPLPSESVREHVERLRMEAGWVGVREGLGRILVGYYVLFFGTTVTVLFMMLALGDLLKSSESDTTKVGAIWALWISVAVIGLIQLYGFVTILKGKWACLLNSPERGGARWLIFACMICIVMGPVLNLICSFGGVPRADKLAALLNMYTVLQLAGIALSLASSILFVLFLRAVVSCFGDEGSVSHLNLFLFLDGVLTATVVFLFVTDPEVFFQPGTVLGMIGCGFGVAVWYLYLLARVHSRVGQLIRQLPSLVDL
jgi:hypothetical protein